MATVSNNLNPLIVVIRHQGQKYESTCLSMQKSESSKDLKNFKSLKLDFKTLIHQFIDRKGTQEQLKELGLAVALNSDGKDRIAQKINRFYKKHNLENGEDGESKELISAIRQSAAKLASIYPTIDKANFGTPEKPVFY